MKRSHNYGIPLRSPTNEDPSFGPSQKASNDRKPTRIAKEQTRRKARTSQNESPHKDMKPEGNAAQLHKSKPSPTKLRQQIHMPGAQARPSCTTALLPAPPTSQPGILILDARVGHSCAVRGLWRIELLFTDEVQTCGHVGCFFSGLL